MYCLLQRCVRVIPVLTLMGLSPAYAASAKVDMLTAIIDPTLLDEESALAMCEEYPEMVKCEVVKEKLREQVTENIREYDVLVANFE